MLTGPGVSAFHLIKSGFPAGTFSPAVGLVNVFDAAVMVARNVIAATIANLILICAENNRKVNKN